MGHAQPTPALSFFLFLLTRASHHGISLDMDDGGNGSRRASEDRMTKDQIVSHNVGDFTVSTTRLAGTGDYLTVVFKGQVPYDVAVTHCVEAARAEHQSFVEVCAIQVDAESETPRLLLRH